MDSTSKLHDTPCEVSVSTLKEKAQESNKTKKNGIILHNCNGNVNHETDTLQDDDLTERDNSDAVKSKETCMCDPHNKNICQSYSHVTNGEKQMCITSAINKIRVNDTSETLTDIDEHGISYVVYESELQMPDIIKLITKDLSEPYSIYTYRYFIHNWPKLCFLAMEGGACVGAIVCKLDVHKKEVRRGYIAMLAVDHQHRRKGIGSHLVLKAIKAMIRDDCDEVVLETEISNKSALRLYGNLGFVRDKRLFRYYLNGVDALRLKLWLR